MDITNYIIGLLTGVSVSTFFIGKELLKFYTKYKVQQKKLDRALKLNDKIQKFKTRESIKTPNFNIGE